MEPILQMRNLTTQIPTKRGVLTAVDDVSFSLQPGEIFGMVGESGSGKSMTCRSILQLVPSPGKITGGEVIYRGRDLLQLTPMVHERLEELQQAPELLEFFFKAPRPGAGGYDPALLVPKKTEPARAADMLRAVHAALNALDIWSPGVLEEALRTLCETLDVKPGPLFGAVRVAVSGRTVAPPLFDMLAALGRDEVLARVAVAAAALE